MTTKYKRSHEVPTAVLAKRLGELSDAVGKRGEERDRELTRRVPAELDRDADLVLYEAAKRLLRMEAERDGWDESARHFANGQEFYQGIVRQVGNLFGEAAYTSDDGSVQDDVLALKVPELVEALAAHVEQIREAFLPGNDGTDGGRLLAIGYVLNQSPTTSIARQKLLWQAEALDVAIERGYRTRSELEGYAEHLRRQAEEDK